MEYVTMVAIIDHANIAAPPYIVLEGNTAVDPNQATIDVLNDLGGEGWRLRGMVSFDLTSEVGTATFNASVFARPI